MKYVSTFLFFKTQCKCCIINVILVLCFTRASGTVYTAIDIATGQEVSQILMLIIQHSHTVYCFFFLAKPLGLLLFWATDSLSVFSGGHQADEPAAAAQERADYQWNLGDEGKQKLQYSELLGQVSFHSQGHISHIKWIYTWGQGLFMVISVKRRILRPWHFPRAQGYVFK